MSYTRADVTAAKTKILAACPLVLAEELDYGYTLIVYKPEWWTREGERPTVVYWAKRGDDEKEIMRDADEVIAELNR